MEILIPIAIAIAVSIPGAVAWHHHRQRHRLSAAGWVGWPTLLAAPGLLSRLRKSPQLAAERLCDHPQISPAEACDALRVLQRIDPRGVGIAGAPQAFAGAERRLIRELLARGPVEELTAEEVRYLEKRLERIERDLVAWAQAARFAMHRRGLAIDIADPAQSCRLAWRALTGEDRLHALDLVLSQGSPPQVLVEKAAVAFVRELAADDSSVDALRRFGDRVERLCAPLGTADARIFLAQETCEALDAGLAAAPADVDPESLAAVRLVLGRHMAARVTEADARGRPLPFVERFDLLDDLRPHWQAFPVLEQAASVLAAHGRLEDRVELIHRAAGTWPQLRAPAEYLRTQSSDSDDLRRQALLKQWRSQASAENAVPLATSLLAAGADGPLAAMLHQATIRHVGENGKAVAWLGWLERRFVASAAETPPVLQPAELRQTASELARLPATWHNGDEVVAGLVALSQALLDHPVDKPQLRRDLADGVGACLAACIAQTGEGGELAGDLDHVAGQAFGQGSEDHRLIAWLARRWAAAAASLCDPEQLQLARELFHAARAAGEPWGVRGLVRLPLTPENRLLPAHLVEAWKQGESGDELLRSFAALAEVDPRLPFRESEVDLAVAVYRSEITVRPELEKRLLRALWLVSEPQDGHRELVSELLERHRQDTGLLADFLESFPEADEDTPLPLFALAELSRQGHASAAQNRRLIAAGEAGRRPVELAPYLGLTDPQVGSAVERLETLLRAVTGLGTDTVLDSPLAARIPTLVEQVWIENEPAWRRMIGTQALRQLLLAGAEQSALTRAVAIRACCSTPWSPDARALLESAATDDLLDAEQVVFLCRGQWHDEEDVEAALRGIRWLCEQGLRLDAASELLADICERGGQALASLGWVDLPLLAAFEDRGHHHPALRRALAKTLFRDPDGDRQQQRRLTAQLVQAGVEVPLPALCQALEIAGDPATTDILLRPLLAPAETLEDRAWDALIQVVDRDELATDQRRWQVLSRLDRAGRMPPGAAPDLVRLSFELNRTDGVAGDPVKRYESELLEQSWSDGLTEAVVWYCRRAAGTGEELAPLLVDRLRRETDGAFAVPQRRDRSRLEQLRRKLRAGEPLAVSQLLQLTEEALLDSTGDELETVAAALCTRLAAASMAERSSPATLDLLMELERRGQLSTEGRCLLVDSLARSERVDSLARVGRDDLLALDDRELLRRVLRLLLPHARHRRLAAELLLALTSEHGQELFVDELLAACQSQIEAGELTDQALPLSLAEGLLAGADPRSLESGLAVLLRWPVELDRELDLLLAAAEADAIPRSEEAFERLDRHSTELEKLGSAASLQRAERLRRQLQTICDDPCIERLNDLALVVEHRDLPPAKRLLRLFSVTPEAGPALSDLTNHKDLIDAAVEQLPGESPWSEDELDLAEVLVRDAAALPQVLSKPTPSLARLVERMLQQSQDRVGAIDTLSVVLQRQPRHSQAEAWFRSLLERLYGAQNGLRDLVTEKIAELLNATILSPSQTRQLIRFGLELADCPSQPLLASARHLGRLSVEDAVRLTIHCLRAGEREPAFSILRAFARLAGLETAAASDSPGFELEVSDQGLSDGSFEEFVEDYLREDEDPRAQLWNLEIQIRFRREERATVLAWEVKKRLDEASGRANGDVSGPAGWTEPFDSRYRQLVGELARSTGMGSYRGLGPQQRLLSAVNTWLDLEMNPVAAPDRATTRRILEATEVFDELESGANVELDQHVKPLQERAWSVRSKAVDLLDRWVPQHPEELRDPQMEATIDDWIRLADLMAVANPAAAQRRFESVQSWILPRPPEKGGEEIFERVARCSLNILRSSLRESRRAVALTWIAKINRVTMGFIRPGLRPLPGHCKTVYAQLMTWCSLAHILDAAAGAGRQRLTHTDRWIGMILRDGAHAVVQCQPEILSQAQEALETGELVALRRVVAESELAALDRWAGGAAAVEGDVQAEEIGLFAGRYRLVEVLADEHRNRRSRLQLMQDLGPGGDDLSGPKVVVKILPQPEKSVEFGRMQREAALLARLDHPGLIRLIDEPHLEEAPYYLVMEYIAGRSLDQWLSGTSPPSVHEKLRIFWHLLAALGAMHSADCVHRNLHPRNVLVVPEGTRRSRVVVTDMSSIKPFDAAPEAQTTLLDGAFDYQAPEQRSSNRYRLSSSVDIFSLGKILAFLFTNKREPDPQDWPSALPGLSRIYSQAVHPDPRHRYGGEAQGVQGIEEMTSDFRPVMAGLSRFVLVSEAERASGLTGLSRLVEDLQLLRNQPAAKMLKGRLADGSGREVAIKVISRRSEQGRQIRSRIRRVASLSAAIEGIPGVVQIPRPPYDDANNYYLFSDLVSPGVSLADVYANQRRRIDPGVLVAWMHQALDALAECHRRQIVHRCLKPSNLLLDRDATIRISDFALGRLYSEKMLLHTTRLNRGDAYTAPEVLRGIKASHEGADLFSLLLSFSIGLTTRPDRQPANLEQHRNSLALGGRGSRLTFLTEPLCAQLAPDPADRPAQGAAEFHALLRESLRGRKLDDGRAKALLEGAARYVPPPRRVEHSDLFSPGPERPMG